MSVMKIGMLIAAVTRKSGGVFNIIVELTKTLNRLYGLSITIFGTSNSHEEYLLPELRGLSIQTFKWYGLKSFKYSPGLTKALKNVELDLLHSHGCWMYSSYAALKWAKYWQRPYIVSPHGMLDPWALKRSRFKKAIVAWLFENKLLKRAACLHALCEAEAKAIRTYGLSNPICVIPNGVTLPEKNFVNMSPPWSNILSESARILLYFSRLHPKKGVFELIKAWKYIKKEKLLQAQNWHLVIAGWGEADYVSQLKKYVIDNKLNDTIHFIGPQYNSSKDAVYRFSDAFILPSYSEGLPIVVLEAWAYKLPVLMTPQCNLPEGFKKGAALKILPSVESIKNGIIELIKMSDRERAQMGIKGRELIDIKFNWNKVAEDMYKVYKWLVGGGSPPDCVITD